MTKKRSDEYEKAGTGKQFGDGTPGRVPGSPGFVGKVARGLATALAAAFSLSPGLSGPGQASTRLMVAFSGGPDSTALLGALLRLPPEMGLDLCLCHVNHHLRGEESDSDERFCIDLAGRWSVPLAVRHVAAGPDGSCNRSEEELRAQRYSLLEQAARDFDVGLIVLAHTLDDQIETLLFRLLRGTSPAGLVGMEPARRLTGDTIVVRPLVSVSRAQCLEFLQESGQAAVHDSSNDNPLYTRNYIRHKLIPPIRDRFPGFEQRLEQLRQLIAQDEAVLNEITNRSIQDLAGGHGMNADSWELNQFLALPEGLRRRVLARSMQARGVAVSFERVRSTLGTCQNPGGGALSLDGAWDFRVQQDRIIWIDKRAAPKAPPELEVEVKIPGMTPFLALGQALKVERWDQGDSACPPARYPGPTALEAVVDLSAASLPIVVRNRRPGDRIRPFGMDKQVKLKKFLHNQKLEGSSKSAFAGGIVLADQEEILWVPGVGLSQKVRVSGKPTHTLGWVELARDEMPLC